MGTNSARSTSHELRLAYLDGKTPRQAVRTAGGRRRVADPVRMIENGEERNRRERGFGYDVSWMQMELRLDPLGRVDSDHL